MHKRTLIALVAVVLVAAALPAGAQTVAEAFKQVKDAIVVVRTEGSELAPTGSRENVSVSGLGSGVLIAREGMILTAAHVVQTAEMIEVEFTSGETISGKVYASEPGVDVAVIKLDRPPAQATVARVGNSDNTQVGEQVFIVGAPLGISHTLTVGHISARRTMNGMYGPFEKMELFQTDAAINPGNSGGPMFNMNGEVIGVVSHIISQTGGSQGLGFVVTSNLARDLVLKQRTMWSGMEGFALYGELAEIFNLPQSHGTLVQKVAKNSPAERLGIKAGTIIGQIDGQPVILGGDIILAVNGISLAEPDAGEKIAALRASYIPGEKMTVTVFRGGKKMELSGIPMP
jgi:S1-C subfamily serine protease